MDEIKRQINGLLLKMQNGENCIGETANELLHLFNVNSDILVAKAQLINALTNTLDVNQNELGGYQSIRENSFEKLNNVIKSIDIK